MYSLASGEANIDSVDEEHTGDVNRLPHEILRQSFELAPLANEDEEYDYDDYISL